MYLVICNVLSHDFFFLLFCGGGEWGVGEPKALFQYLVPIEGVGVGEPKALYKFLVPIG